MKIVWGRSLGFNLDLMKLKRQAVDYTILTDGAGCYPWREVFLMWPRKSINGKRLFWQKVFKRKVWIVWGTGFHMEPDVQYATAFDMLNDTNVTWSNI